MLNTIFDAASDAFDRCHAWLFESLIQPALFAMGMGNLLEDGFIATVWLMVGVLQLAVMWLVFGALERWRPVEAVRDPAAVRDDVIYTLIHRLGLFRLGMFFALGPWFDDVVNALRLQGWQPWQLDAVWPGVTDGPLLAFLLYLLLFDFVDYVLHRSQHRVNLWWQLHALHHSQQQMTYWSDNRNHLLDDVLRDVALVSVALLVGVPPGQFIAIVAVTQMAESLSHANVRMAFGPWLGKVFVSPNFHRHHHSIGAGHESTGIGSLGGHNFAVLFPVWDIVFGTADFSAATSPTGVRDQLVGYGSRRYGRGFWQQQWFGLQRLVGRR